MSRPDLGDREGPLTEWQEAARFYRAVLGWPSGVFGTAVWVLAGYPVEALDAPEALSRCALTLLGDGAGPVFEAPGDHGTRWVLLTRPRADDPSARAPELAGLGVEHLWAGATLDLPPSRFGTHRLRWINSADTPVPAFTTVAAAIIQAAR